MPRLPTISGSTFSSYPLACRRRLLGPGRLLPAAGGSGFAAKARTYQLCSTLNRPVWRARASPAGGGTPEGAREGSRAGTSECLLFPREPLDPPACRQGQRPTIPAGHRLRKPTVISADGRTTRMARRLRPCHPDPGHPRGATQLAEWKWQICAAQASRRRSGVQGRILGSASSRPPTRGSNSVSFIPPSPGERALAEYI